MIDTLKALLLLVLDIMCVKFTVTLWVETDGDINGYIILCAAFVALFTWELINTIKGWLK